MSSTLLAAKRFPTGMDSGLRRGPLFGEIVVSEANVRPNKTSLDSSLACRHVKVGSERQQAGGRLPHPIRLRVK